MVLTASETRKQARESLKGKWGNVILITLIYLVYNLLIGFFAAIPFLGFIIDIAAIVIGIPILYGFTMTIMKLKRGEKVDYFDFFIDGFANFKRAWCVTGRLLLKMIVPLVLIVIAVIALSIIATVSMFIILGLGAKYSTSAATVDLSQEFLSSIISSGFGIVFVITVIVLIASYIWLFIKALSYGLGIFIAIDNPNMSALDCVNKSKEIMNGKKVHLFCLYLSFIGWLILALVLCLIPFIGAIVPLVASLVLVPYLQFAIISFYENNADMISTATPTEGNVTSTDDTQEVTEETANNTTNTIKEKSGSTDVKAEIVDIPEMDYKDNE